MNFQKPNVTNLKHSLPWLHISEHLNVVGHLREGGRVVIGIDDQDVDCHRRALLHTVRCNELGTPGKDPEGYYMLLHINNHITHNTTH